MPTSVDVNVLPVPVNLVPQGVRTVAATQQNGGNGKDAQATFAGVLKDTSAVQADGAETVQLGAEPSVLLSTLQNSGLVMFTGQSLSTKAGKDNQLLSSVQTGDEQATADVSVNMDLLMAALLSAPLPANTTVAAKSSQGVAPIQKVTEGANNLAGISLLQMQMPVQAATNSAHTAMVALPVQAAAADVEKAPFGNASVQLAVQETALDSLATTILPGQTQQQTHVANRMNTTFGMSQPAASLLGNAGMQGLNIRQISVTTKANSATPLPEKTAVSADGEADGTVAIGKPSVAIAGYAGTEAQADLNLAAFAEPNQDKLKAAPGDEQAVSSFAAVVGQQAEKLNLTASVGQTAPQQLPDPHHVLGQVLEQGSFAKPAYDAGNTEMVIKLKPESLGELTLKVAVDNGVVSASFHSDNPEVRGVLQSSLQQLRQELTDRGLQVDNVGVYAGLTDFSSGGQQEAFRQQQQQSAALKHNHTSDDFITAVESTPVLQNTAVDDGVDYRV